jgi:putative ABC transport system substrate-binding protein
LVEGRWAQGEYGKLEALFSELVELKVDALVTFSTPAGIAAKNVTRTVPIIDAAMGDPVGNGLAASLARPGGNVTGLSWGWSAGTGGKLVELLQETVPRLTAVAWLTNPNNQWEQTQRDELVAAAKVRGIKLQIIPVHTASDLQRALEQARRQAQALLVFGDPLLWSHRKEITTFASVNRFPAMYGMRDFVDAGGLMAYGPNNAILWRRAAEYVDRVLKGTNPEALPIEQISQYSLTINLKVAMTLGISVPDSILVRADEVLR